MSARSDAAAGSAEDFFLGNNVFILTIEGPFVGK